MPAISDSSESALPFVRAHTGTEPESDSGLPKRKDSWVPRTRVRDRLVLDSPGYSTPV